MEALMYGLECAIVLLVACGAVVWGLMTYAKLSTRRYEKKLERVQEARRRLETARDGLERR